MIITRNDADEVKSLLKDRIVDLCHVCLPRGRREGQEWVSHNPFVDEARKTPALKVALTGNKGAWRDWRNGDKGDILDLIVFTQGCADFKQTLAWARDFLGLEKMSPAQRQSMRRDIEMRKQKDEADDRARRARKLQRAQELFYTNTMPHGLNSGPELHAQAYFAARGCPHDQIQHVPEGTHRYSPATEWWKGAEYASTNGGSRKVKPGPAYPAIHTAMRSISGAITCCHVTFLDPVLPAKAPLEPPKLMYGEALGSAIEICQGPAAQNFWECAVPHPLIIAEGIETARCIAVACSDWARVWAAGSLAGIGHVPVQLACISEIFVARDNNEGNAQARQQLNAALVRLEEAGKPLAVVNSHVGDDFANLMKGE